MVTRSFPKTSGRIILSGLNGPVLTYFDKYNIPQIYANTRHDLFFAQGYIHAQERFWQMDFYRHIGAGRLSEMFGHAEVRTDSFIRTLGWPEEPTSNSSIWMPNRSKGSPTIQPE